MFTRRTTASLVVGVLGLVLAIAACAVNSPALVLVAAALAVLCLILVLFNRGPGAAADERAAALEAHAAELARQQDLIAERAARFEAEAIAARAQLAQAMRADIARKQASARQAAAPPEPLPTEPTPQASAPVESIDLSTDRTPSPRDVITDPETGLFSEVFFEASLAKRISASRRGLRPLSVAVAEIVTGVGTPDVAPAPVAPVAETMINVFREADTLARGPGSLFLILLEDTPENGAIWTLERLRRRLAEDHDGFTLRVGLSCYPAYGFDADQLMRQAYEALEAAREWHQDRIEVTTSTPDD